MATSIAYYRDVESLSQRDLGRIMRGMGFAWNETTVAKIETGARTLTAAELVALCLVFQVGVGDLVQTQQDDWDDLAMTIGDVAVSSWWMRSLVEYGVRAEDAIKNLPDVFPANLAQRRNGELREQINQRLGAWLQAQQLLGKEITPAMRRAKLSALWKEIANG